MKQCVYCGKSIIDDAVLCVNCGKMQNEYKPVGNSKQKSCPYCGNQCFNDAVLCISCGKPLKLNVQEKEKPLIFILESIFAFLGLINTIVLGNIMSWNRKELNSWVTSITFFAVVLVLSFVKTTSPKSIEKNTIGIISLIYKAMYWTAFINCLLYCIRAEAWELLIVPMLGSIICIIDCVLKKDKLFLSKTNNKTISYIFLLLAGVCFVVCAVNCAVVVFGNCKDLVNNSNYFIIDIIIILLDEAPYLLAYLLLFFGCLHKGGNIINITGICLLMYGAINDIVIILNEYFVSEMYTLLFISILEFALFILLLLCIMLYNSSQKIIKFILLGVSLITVLVSLIGFFTGKVSLFCCVEMLGFLLFTLSLLFNKTKLTIVN